MIDDNIRISVCMVAHNALPLLLGTGTQVVGGAEVQQVLLARELRRNGCEMSFVSYDRGELQASTEDGIAIHKTYRPEDGYRYIRFFHPRLTSIWRALRRASADVYYLRCEHRMAGILAAFCLWYGKGYVYGLGHDSECYRGADFLGVPNFRDDQFHRFSLSVADCVISQTEFQRKTLLENFGRDSIVLGNFWQPAPRVKKKADPPFVLWVGTIREWKRPHYCIRLAKAMPDIRFEMIGGPDYPGDPLFKEIEDQAGKLGNLTFHGFLPARETADYFQRASLYINTSLYEGFPNTFLQAWDSRIPTVSFIDPDGAVESSNIGLRAIDIEDMEGKVRYLMENRQVRGDLGKAAYRHLCDHHHIERAVEQYIEIFRNVTRKKMSSPGGTGGRPG